MNLRTVSRGDAVAAGAAFLLLIASFLPYYDVSTVVGNGLGQFRTVTTSYSAWNSSTFPLLPSVFLLGIFGGALIVLARLVPRDPKPAGIPLGHWGTVLAVASFWGALWSLFSSGSHGVGAYLALLFSLLLAAAAVAAPLVPALSVPLLSAAPAAAPVGPGGYPAYGQPAAQPGQYPYQQQPQFQHGEPVQQAQPGQPFTGPQAPAGPQQGGAYGYPQQGAPSYGGQSFGGQYGAPTPAQASAPAPAPAPAPTPTPAPVPQDTPPQYQDQPEHRDQATAILTPAMKQQADALRKDGAADSGATPEAEPTPAAEATPAPAPAAEPAPAAAGAPAFAPFWFAVPAARSLAPEDDADGPAVGELVPGTWYLAIAQRGDTLLTQTQEGRRGILADTSGIQRG